MTAVLLDALAPIFAILGLGYLAGWIREIDNRHVDELNVLVTDFALPAALFVATASARWSLVKAQWPLLLLLTTSTLVLYGSAYSMQRWLFRAAPATASVQALTVAQPNYGAAGLPLISAVFDSNHLIYVAFALAFSSIFVSPLTLAILEASCSTSVHRGWMTPLRALLKPIVVSPIAGFCFAFADIPLPDFVARSFDLIGQAGAGVALFLTGVILSSQSVVLNSNVLSGALLKNVVHPLFVVVGILLIPVSRDAGRIAVLLAALPSGFFGVLFGLRYGLESHDAGSTLILSSVLSVITLATVLLMTG
jgi:malonate transporter